ncbi:hypothetical protein AAJ76_6000013877 [Vairimorpha ceranae]|uniref:Uncharacterized protein n=1 Tax=Vairimorpha ceranae TaxID=40302 RepID=A0A0F9YPH6_9MICR|nr:hypothetical protein AAJ76_6000013877 [Vairimorpha ceranae]KAF5140848.1 hypothetical protein G9O61_00g009950 [Vairimorpha ceranae]KAF5141039.1 hypothetical protein G9O61_00g007300 [Vairimorpha ceranae]KKO74552.1 hypothetical protein AAJ76_6000013877 [Vairimorpha ceranae]
MYLAFFLEIIICAENTEDILNSAYFKNFEKFVNGNHCFLRRQSILKYLRFVPFAEEKTELLFDICRKTYKILKFKKYNLIKSILIRTHVLLYLCNNLNLKSLLIATFMSRLNNLCLLNYDGHRTTLKSHCTLKFQIVTYINEGSIDMNYMRKVEQLTEANIEELLESVKSLPFILNINLIYELARITNLAEKALETYSTPQQAAIYGNFLNPKFIENVFEVKHTATHFFLLFDKKDKKLDRINFNCFGEALDINFLNDCIKYDSFRDGPDYSPFINLSKDFDIFCNETITLSFDFADIFLGLIQCYSKHLKRNILLSVEKHANDQVSLQFIICNEMEYAKKMKEYYARAYKSAPDISSEIENLIKIDKVHEFTTLTDLHTYSFRPNGTEGIDGWFYWLDCGHFLGFELIDDFLTKLDHNCHLCRRLVGIKICFQHKAYKVK